MRKVAVGWGEIVKALREGGFDLPRTKQAEDEARLTTLRNTANLVLVGDNYFGLKSWYPEKREKDKNVSDDSARSKKARIAKENAETTKGETGIKRQTICQAYYSARFFLTNLLGYAILRSVSNPLRR
jgi:hypothetical protein